MFFLRTAHLHSDLNKTRENFGKGDYVMNKRKKIWFLAIILVITALLVGLSTGCFTGKSEAKETAAATTQDTTEKAILIELQNLNKNIEELKESSAAKTTAAETTATTTIETTTETTAATETTVSNEAITPEGIVPVPYETEGGLPTSGTTWAFDVISKETEVLTGGVGMINGAKLPGGDNPDRGFVIIMLPSTNTTIRYEVSELWPGSNWHASYKYGRIPTKVDWQALLDQRTNAMFDPKEGNGTHGEGVWILDQIVVQGTNIIFQQTVKRQ